MAGTAAIRCHSLGNVGPSRSARSPALLERLADLAEAAAGRCCCWPRASGRRRRPPRALYATAREEEWAEFDADCGKYLADS